MSVSDSDLTTGVFIPVDIRNKVTSGMSTLPDITMQSTSSSVSPGISHQATNSSTLSTDTCQVSNKQIGGKFSAACFQVDCFSPQLTGKNIYTQPTSGHTSPCTSKHAISCSTLPCVNDQATNGCMLSVDGKHDNNLQFKEYCQIVNNGTNSLQAVDNEPNYLKVVGNEPNYLQVVGNEPNYLQVVGNEPNYLQVVDNDPNYLQIVDDESNYLQIVDDESNYLQIVGDESDYFQVVNNKPTFHQIVENDLCHLKTIQMEPDHYEAIDSDNQQITTGNDESFYHQIADDELNYQQIESDNPGYEENTFNELNTTRVTYKTTANTPMDYYELHVTEDENCDFRNWIRNNKLVNTN
jgi:hypothetical protein